MMAVQGLTVSVPCLNTRLTRREGFLQISSVTSGTQCRAVSVRSWVLAPFGHKQQLSEHFALPRKVRSGAVFTVQRGGIRAPLLKCIADGQTKAGNATVVVTRERGKNGKLIEALAAKGIQCLELPLIEHKEGPDVHRLPAALQEQWDWIVITSPEAASVFLQGWREAGSPNVRVATVGGGTTDSLINQGPALKIAFTPSKATGKVLSAELPMLESTIDAPATGRVLYPSSAKAGTDVQRGLEERGFQVTRLNTYSTEAVKDLDSAILAAAAAAPVATFASPSTVKAWVEHIASKTNWEGAAACIGATSAEAAENAGFKRIFFPQRPGISGWVTSIVNALEAMEKKNASVA